MGATETNALFVRADASAFNDLETSLAAVATAANYTYVVTDYAGRAVIIGALPYGYRTGRPALGEASVRRNVSVRWTWRGIAREVLRVVRRVARGRS